MGGLACLDVSDTGVAGTISRRAKGAPGRPRARALIWIAHTLIDPFHRTTTPPHHPTTPPPHHHHTTPPPPHHRTIIPPHNRTTHIHIHTHVPTQASCSCRRSSAPPPGSLPHTHAHTHTHVPTQAARAVEEARREQLEWERARQHELHRKEGLDEQVKQNHLWGPRRVVVCATSPSILDVGRAPLC